MLNKFMFAFPAAMAVSASATELAFDIGAGVTSNYNAAVAADVTRIVKTGDGTLVLEQAAASGFKGVTEVKGGTLVVHNSSALGDAAANTVTVSDGATFKVENLTNKAINNKFFVAGDGFDGQGALCYNRGSVAAGNSGLTFFTIELTGNASFSKNERSVFKGPLVLNGHTFTYPSTKGEFEGDFIWDWSTIDGTGGGHVVAKKDITLQGMVTFKGTAENTLTLDGSAMRTYDATMTFPWTLISAQGLFQVYATQAESGIENKKNRIDGPVQIEDSLTLSGWASYGRLAGPISGAGGVTSSSSHHYLTGTNTYEGETQVTGGTLTIASEWSLPGYDEPNRVTLSYGTLELTMSPLFTGWDCWSGEALQDLLDNMTVSGGAISLRTPSGVGTTKDIPKSVHHHGEGTLITEGKKSGDGMIYNDQGNWVFRAPSTVTQELASVNVYKGTMAFVNQQMTNVGTPRWALSPDRQDATWVQHGGKTWTAGTLSVNYMGGLGEYRVEAGAEVAFSNNVAMIEGDPNAAYTPMSVFVADGTGTVFECHGYFNHVGNSNSTSLVCVNNGAALGAQRFARGTTKTARPDRKSYFAFNGGELRSLWGYGLFNTEDQSQDPDRAISFENGLAVNSCGTTTDWISFNLEAPTGLGITEVTLPTEATEATYEAPPKMRLAGGDGIAAWVYADWDPATKKVAAKAKIASPGVDFTVAPTCTVEKPDGSGTWVCEVTIGKCKSGGVRKVGLGDMQLTGTHTYEGPTVVEKGKLTFSGRSGSNSQFPTNSAIIVCKDATLSLARHSAYTVKSISGGGTVSCNSSGTITVLDGIAQDADTLLRDERTYVEGKIAFGADAKVVIREPEKLEKGKRYLLTETTEGFSGTLPTLVTDGTDPIKNGKVQIRNDRYLYFSISQGMIIMFK